MSSEGDELKLQWLKINDRKDIQCRDCSSPPVMKITRAGVSRAYLCEKHGREIAERDGLPLPEGQPAKIR
jgi:hypothetical protein